MDTAQERRTIMAWRRSERARLINLRSEMPLRVHQEASAAIAARLQELLAELKPALIGFYWPYRREFDARHLIEGLIAGGASAALPVVVQKNAPLEFRLWRPWTKLASGVYGIPFPAEGDAEHPTALLVPMVGFDASGYRLGYGGGYYDRTFAAFRPKPLAIGVAFDFSRLDSIRPLLHDVPMDYVVTETMCARRSGARLENHRGG